MGRSIFTGSLVYDQIDIYQSTTSIVRATGVDVSFFTKSTFFVDNMSVSWPVIDGSNVPDSSISAGSVYFNEISTNPGFYSIRLYPDRVGFWRLVFSLPTFGQEKIISFDVASKLADSGSALNASFIK